MNGQQCYCISKFGQDGPSNSCTIPCASDVNNYCGSYEAMSVYATGQQGMVFVWGSNTNLELEVTFIVQRVHVTKYKTIPNAHLIQ